MGFGPQGFRGLGVGVWAGVQGFGLGLLGFVTAPVHFQVGSYRFRSLIEGLYTLSKPYRSPVYPKLPTCSYV